MIVLFLVLVIVVGIDLASHRPKILLKLKKAMLSLESPMLFQKRRLTGPPPAWCPQGIGEKQKKNDSFISVSFTERLSVQNNNSIGKNYGFVSFTNK